MTDMIKALNIYRRCKYFKLAAIAAAVITVMAVICIINGKNDMYIGIPEMFVLMSGMLFVMISVVIVAVISQVRAVRGSKLSKTIQTKLQPLIYLAVSAVYLFEVFMIYRVRFVFGEVYVELASSMMVFYAGLQAAVGIMGVFVMKRPILTTIIFAVIMICLSRTDIPMMIEGFFDSFIGIELSKSIGITVGITLLSALLQYVYCCLDYKKMLSVHVQKGISS